jgi:uncharacterized protein (DUF2164 family)
VAAGKGRDGRLSFLPPPFHPDPFTSGDAMRGKPSITLSDEKRKQAVASLRRFMAESMDEEIGDLKARLLLDYVLAEIGPTIYNAAIGDARAFFEERAADLDGTCYREEFPYWGRR